MTYDSTETELAEKFAKDLVEDQTSLKSDTDKSVINPHNWLEPTKLFRPSFISYGPFPDTKSLPEMVLPPWRGSINHRLDRQTKDIRRRLEDPSAIILVVKGRNYSAKSFKGILWLYLKTKLFDVPIRDPYSEKKVSIWGRMIRFIRRK